ncbi:FAD-dependent oxidoreductase [Microbacterium sp.]|uniref:FAD-dependent oxidoreductase n=1 Tax=Microbacterium sp. TaxID=51671 RepID=UPI0039E56276
MTTHVAILGAGAAGTAAARVLAGADGVEVALVGRTSETPYNRTLVNKGVAIGMLQPEQAALPGVVVRSDSAERIDLDARAVTLESGAVLRYDALLVATGSAPRRLSDAVPGAAGAAAAGRLTTLHSLDDAVRVRDVLAGRASARVVVLGAGLVAAETASLLHERGHRVTMVARADVPGASAFGVAVAIRLAERHRQTVTTRFGRTPTSIALEGDELVVTLDDGSSLRADLAIVAHGTRPIAPAPFADGVVVDARLRASSPGVYAAGGVAVHHDDGSAPWRIDHWADAAAQGEHAARTVLHDLGLAADPGPYLPRSPYTANIHGSVVAAVGRTGADGTLVSTDPLVVVHEHDGVARGASGVDAVPAVFSWMDRLHRPQSETAR